MENTFVVKVEEISRESNQSEVVDNKINQGGEACYNVIREEYLHTFSKSEKLDNKISITLTVFGFIFLFITGLLGDIRKFTYPINIQQLILIVIYIIATLIVLGLFIYVMLKLIKLLEPMHIQRLDSNYILDNNLQQYESNTVYTIAAIKCTAAINDIGPKLENRFREYKKCMGLIIPIVLISFTLYFLQIFIIMD